MNNEIKGKVIEVLPMQSGETRSGGTWYRQTVVLEYESGRYTQQIALECGTSKAPDFGKLQKGQIVKVRYDVTSREYNGRWYTSANAFEWEVLSGGRTPQAPAGDDPF